MEVQQRVERVEIRRWVEMGGAALWLEEAAAEQAVPHSRMMDTNRDGYLGSK